MVILRRWVLEHRLGLPVGAIVAAVGCIAFALGWLDRIDRYGQNLHFQHFSTVAADPRITLIDIDDHALDRVGRWPWPRRVHAELIQTLNDLGADAIVMDVGFFEPTIPHCPGERTRSIHTWATPAGIVPPVPESADDDDRTLAVAMALAGNVYLPIVVEFAPPGTDPAKIRAQAAELMRQDSSIDAERFSAALPQGERIEADVLYAVLRMELLLEEDFTLTEQELGETVGAAAARRHLSNAKRRAARRLADTFLTSNPDGDSATFLGSVLTTQAPNHRSADRAELCDALTAQRAARLIVGGAPETPGALAGLIAHGYDATLPIAEVAAAAKGVGFATYDRSLFDGTLREIPPVVDLDGHLVWQLGCRVACDVLALSGSAPRWSDERLTIDAKSNGRRIPLNRRGATVLNWHVPEEHADWPGSFHQIPAARVLEVADKRAAMADNADALVAKVAELVAVRLRDMGPQYADYELLLRRRYQLDREMETAKSPATIARIDEDRAGLDPRIAAIESEAIEWLEYQWSLWRDVEPADDAERAERERLAALHGVVGQGQLAERVERLNANLRQRSDALARELRPSIEGKICFVGVVATGVADLVTTPVHASMPGVMAHAHMANMLLQNRFVSIAPRPVNLVLMAVACLSITLLTCLRGPLFGLCSLAGVNAATLGGGAAAFYLASYHVASLPACVVASVVWAMVTVYRQFTEERAKRRFRRALAQYTAPAVAKRIAARTTLTDIAPQAATVTCFFSDLTGFTSLAERLGAEHTKRLLNPYLECVSRALVEHHAIVNKFVGDGIFAFLNAPIWACPDHADAGCLSALAAQEAVGVLNRANGANPIDPMLHVRIGLSTGEAFVGDYGSAAKLDYTCIGDVVNIGARLETANKAFGTRILVDDATKLQAKTSLVFRPLGRVCLAGKFLPVVVHELLGTSETVNSAARTHAQHFAVAVTCYQSCQWDRCVESLAACRTLRPDDRAADLYDEAARKLQTDQPALDWNRSIEVPMV